MARKNPDIEMFRKIMEARVAAGRQLTIPERRASFDTDMGAVPPATGCSVESLDWSGLHAAKRSRMPARP